MYQKLISTHEMYSDLTHTYTQADTHVLDIITHVPLLAILTPPQAWTLNPIIRSPSFTVTRHTFYMSFYGRCHQSQSQMKWINDSSIYLEEELEELWDGTYPLFGYDNLELVSVSRVIEHVEFHLRKQLTSTKCISKEDDYNVSRQMIPFTLYCVIFKHGGYSHIQDDHSGTPT